MADRYWVNDNADGAWNHADNWATSAGGTGGAGVPGSGDDVFFTSDVTDNCTLDVNINVNSIDIAKAYTGTFTAGTYDVTVAGDFGWGAGSNGTPEGGALAMGSGTWTVGGNFGWGRLTDQTVDAGHVLELTGTAKTFQCYYSSGTPVFRTLRFAASSSYTNASSYEILIHDLELKSSSSFSLGAHSNNNVRVQSGNRNLTLETGAEISQGSSTAKLGWEWYHGAGTLTNNGTISCNFELKGYRLPAAAISLANITGKLFVSEFSYSQVNLVAGTYTLNDIEFNQSSTSSTWNHNSAAINLTINGDLTMTNFAGTWNKGTGTITLSGDQPQSIDFNGETVEDIEIDTTSTVTLTGGVVTDSLTLTQGTLDVNAQALETTGNFTMAAGTTVTE